MLQLLFRVFKFAMLLYGLWMAWRKSRWLGAAGALWAILRRAPRNDAKRRAAMVFVSALEPAIYRRRGWRKLGGARRPV